MKETGVVKFNCNWIKENPLNENLLIELNLWREKMVAIGGIGVNLDGIGFGNISIRFHQNQFIISGSATGKIKKLSNQHYTKVVEFDLKKNSLTAVGPIIASSESLTHAVIYQLNQNVNAVIHIHNLHVWKKLLNKIPTTNKNVEYGTPAMANEIIHLFEKTNLISTRLLVMGGHEEGIIAFGNDLKEAGNIILNAFET